MRGVASSTMNVSLTIRAKARAEGHGRRRVLLYDHVALIARLRHSSLGRGSRW